MRKIKLKIGKWKRGLAYLTAIVFTFASLGMIVLLNRKIGMLRNVIESEIFLQKSQDKKYVALAHGLNVLQTGMPKGSSIKYSLILIEFNNEPKYSITYDKLPGKKWRVTAAPLGKKEVFPSLPEEFK